MSAIGIAGVMARIATIENRVGSLQQGAFDQALDRATSGAAQPHDEGAALQSVSERYAITGPTVGPLTLGDMVRGLGTAPPIGWSTVHAPGAWQDRIPEAGRPFTEMIGAAAEQSGIDPALLAALVWTESDFRPDAVSRSGAIGLGQLMPATAAGLGVDPTDPSQNLDGAARFLSWQIEQFGSVELGLAAYNAGPGRVREAGGIPDIPETRAYVPRVLERFRLLGGRP